MLDVDHLKLWHIFSAAPYLPDLDRREVVATSTRSVPPPYSEPLLRRTVKYYHYF